MKKALPFLLLVLACTPDVERNPPPSEVIVAQFDPAHSPPVVPAPNDLATRTGKIVVPPSSTDSPAQAEFNASYLGGLTAFPFESTASASFSGPLDPASLPLNVLAADITDTNAPRPVNIVPVWNPSNNSVAVPPPQGGWTRGHHYLILLKGGEGGLRGAQGQAVVGSSTWALASSPKPLVECPNDDLASPDCKLLVDVIPSTESDPAAKLKAQTASAVQLEQLRRNYNQILERVGGFGVDRENVPLLWTFSIVDAGEMTFDPANSTVPFPNDILRNPQTKRVNLPNIATGKPVTPADCAAAADLSTQLTCGLNTLDGFSTMTAPISENSATAGALAQGNLDPKSITTATVNLVRLVSTAPPDLQTPPKFTPCLNCLSSPGANGAPQTTPQQLQWSLDAPLDEKSTYVAYVTTDALDDKGKHVIATPVFALVRSKAALLGGDGRSAVNILSDEQAKQLEPLRVGMAPLFDALDSKGVTRDKIALAFAFTTQSESTVLDQLAGLPKQAGAAGLPDYPLVVQDATTDYQNAATALGIGASVTGFKFFAGAFVTPVLVTGTAGAFNTDPTKAKIAPVQFVVSVPPGAAPAGGFPVTIFGHGFTRSRNDFLSFAGAAGSAGQVIIASDVLFHGERSSCTGSASALKATNPSATDDSACIPTSKCDAGTPIGLCVLRDDTNRTACAPGPTGDLTCFAAGQGLCAADSKCQGAGARLLQDRDISPNPPQSVSTRPLISGWNIFSLTNFFATRDNFRQQVIDLSQLVRVLKGTDPARSFNLQLAHANADTPIPLDGSKINYIGQSLGGILGTLYNSVSPDTNNVVLNVPGGALPQIILNAPSFATQKAALLQVLAGQGINPGTPAFDQFIGIVQWILDPADPANMGYRLTHGIDGGNGPAPNANRKAFIQFIEGDQTVPNIANFALVKGANRTFDPTKPPSFGCQAPLFCYEFTAAGDGFDDTTAPPARRHGFLLSPPGSAVAQTTGKAQNQAATFLATGSLP